MVSDGCCGVTRPQLDIRLFSSYRYHPGSRGVFRILARSRYLDTIVVRCWLYCRTTALGTDVREFWEETYLHFRVCGLYRVPSRVCVVKEHGVYLDLPFPGRMLVSQAGTCARRLLFEWI
jgi:hypothetical protein